MNIIYHWPNVPKTEEKPYTGSDISKPLINLNKVKSNGKFYDIPKDHEDYCLLYYIDETFETINNPDRFRLERQIDVYTQKKHPEFSHLLICERKWIAKEISQDEIIKRLNDELASYLDVNCPEWERSKYLMRIALGTKANEHQYYKEVLQWLDDCRTERDNKENAYLSGTFPDFKQWPVKPSKSK